MERAVPARARSWPVSPHVPADDVLGLLPRAGVGALALLSASHTRVHCMSETTSTRSAFPAHRRVRLPIKNSLPNASF